MKQKQMRQREKGKPRAKKTLVWILVLCLVMGVFPQLSFAKDTTEKSIEELGTVELEAANAKTQAAIDELEENDGAVLYASEGTRDASKVVKMTYTRMIKYEDFFTRNYRVTVDGKTKVAYCVQPKETPPAEGNQTATDYNNSAMVKALYYCYGYPGYAKNLQPYVSIKDKDDDWEDDDDAYALCHMILSYLYDKASINSDAFIGVSAKTKKLVIQCADKIESWADPPTDTSISISPSTASAAWDAANAVQKTQTFTLNTHTDNYITVTVPSGTRLYRTSDGITLSFTAGKKVKIFGGDRFYFTATNAVQGSWSSGTLQGSLQEFNPYMIKVTGHQNIIFCGTGDKDSVSFRVNWVAKGYARLKKVSRAPVITSGSPCYSLAGAEYAVRDSAGRSVGTLTTDANGNTNTLSLMPGTYTVQEIKASKGYATDKRTYSVTVRSNETATVTSTEIPQTDPVQAMVHKIDKETGNPVPQGGANLAGAEFTIKFYDGLYTTVDQVKLLTPKNSWAMKTNSKGQAEPDSDMGYDPGTGIKAFPIGTYTIQETKAPEGYLLPENNPIFLRQITTDGSSSEIVETYNAPTQPEQVKKLGLHIFKAGIDEVNGVIPGLADAEFTIKLQKDVEAALAEGYTYEEIWNGINKNGDKVPVDADRAAAAQTLAPTYTTLTTDENGDAYTEENLPYGKYIGKETKTPKDYYTAEDFVFFLDKDHSEVDIAHKYKNVYINNEQMKSQVKLVKKDKRSGKLVTLTSATFKIKAEQDIVDRATGEVLFAKGEYIKQKVAGKWYDEFKTNSKGTVGTFPGPLGIVLVPLQLPVGEYSIDEISIPLGFLELEAPVKFTIENIRDFDKDEDGDYVTTVELANEQPKGKLELKKTVHLEENQDLTLVDVTDLSGIRFGLYAEKDIVDMADGDVLYHAGEEIDAWPLSPEGSLTVENLWVGSYYLKEDATLPGLVLDETKYPVTFTKEDDTTKVIEVASKVENRATHTSFTKTDITGEEELEGAEMRLTEKESKALIAEWTSSKEKPYKIQGLEVGKTYVLKETCAPDGYVLPASTIEFKVLNTDEVQKVSMKDKYVESVKINEDDEFVAGADYVVTNTRTKQIADKFTTTGGPYKIKNLTEGLEYTITETKAPKGYVLAKPVTFTVTELPVNQKVRLEDKKVDVIKIDTEETPVAGAEFKIIHKDTGKTVDTFTTTEEPYNPSGLVMGETYILRETCAPEGYVLAADLEFTVEDGIKTQTVVCEDKQVSAFKKEESGELLEHAKMQVINQKTKQIVDQWITGKEAHKISNLIEGHSYTLLELEAPEGYVKAKPVDFEVSYEKENQEIEMVDKQVKFIKDSNLEESINGGKFLIKDKESGETVFETTAEKDGVILSGLTEGRTYILSESEVPQGYLKTEDLEFTVTEDKELQIVTMTDEILLGRILLQKGGEQYVIKDKQDYQYTKTEKLAGAKFDIEAAEDIKSPMGLLLVRKGKTADRVETDKNGQATTKDLYPGKYIVKETSAPDGYVLAKDIEVEVTAGDCNVPVYDTSVKIENRLARGTVEITKTDVSDGEPLPDTGIRIHDNDKNVILEGRTDKDGKLTFKELPIGKYYFQEYDAPKGYQINEKLFPFEIKADGDVIKCEMTNKAKITRVPQTGDDMPLMWLFGILALTGMILAGYAIHWRKKVRQ